MLDIYQSIFSKIEAIVYRSRNDAHYTMTFLDGAVKGLTGYEKEEWLHNAKISLVGMTLPEDVPDLVKAADACVAARKPWDLAYRIRHARGHIVHVRERGCPVFEGDELVHIEGLITSATAEHQLRLHREDAFVSSQRRAARITQMTENITGSLKQLNMLSVNARIEAARSGQAGRGFAVVAEEIKRLADQNQQWAQSISAVLAEHRDAGASAVRLSEDN